MARWHCQKGQVVVRRHVNRSILFLVPWELRANTALRLAHTTRDQNNRIVVTSQTAHLTLGHQQETLTSTSMKPTAHTFLQY